MAAASELAEWAGLSVIKKELEFFDTALVAQDDERYVFVIIYRAALVATEGKIIVGSDPAGAQFWGLGEHIESNKSIEPGYKSTFRILSITTSLL